MIRQYTRFIVDNISGLIEKATSQDYPFEDNWEPLEFDPATHSAFDFEIDTNFTDQDFGIGRGRDQEMIRARELLDNFRIVNDQVELQPGRSQAFQAKVLNISAEKAINESVVVPEMVAAIRASLTAGGSSEQELLDDMRKLKPTTPTSLDDMETLEIIRIDKAMRNGP
ncbi:MAG: hypothetical protein E2O82_05055 [Betaproteobacteria bacterium]|nr:MAG: hypothetical protein E2O82_05055 [Betaproteobacteria bacterium]